MFQEFSTHEVKLHYSVNLFYKILRYIGTYDINNILKIDYYKVFEHIF